MHRGLEHLHRVFLGVEVHAHQFEVFELGHREQFVDDRRLRLAGRAPVGVDADEGGFAFFLQHLEGLHVVGHGVHGGGEGLAGEEGDEQQEG